MKKPLTPEQQLGRTVAEAAAIGTKFTIRGGGVAITNAMPIPAPLREALEADKDALWRRMRGDADEAPALALFASLGLRMVVAETVSQARAVWCNLVADLARNGGRLAIDVETAPLPAFWRRAPVLIRKDGFPCKRQPKPDKAEIALDPYRSRITLLQAYAGGGAVYLFHGPAAEVVARSKWLRTLKLVCHNAGFELKQLLLNYTPDDGDGEFRHPVDCTAQAYVIIRYSRSLEEAVKAILDIEMVKAFGDSDWAAPVLSPGQKCYGACDAVFTYKLWLRLNTRLVATKRQRAYVLQRNVLPAVARMELRGAHSTPTSTMRS